MEKSASVLESETATIEDQNPYAKWTAVQIRDELKARGMTGDMLCCVFCSVVLCYAMRYGMTPLLWWFSVLTCSYVLIWYMVHHRHIWQEGLAAGATAAR